MKFYLMNFLSQECNKLFRVGPKVRVGRETGNTGIYSFGISMLQTEHSLKDYVVNNHE